MAIVRLLLRIFYGALRMGWPTVHVRVWGGEANVHYDQLTHRIIEITTPNGVSVHEVRVGPGYAVRSDRVLEGLDPDRFFKLYAA